MDIVTTAARYEARYQECKRQGLPGWFSAEELDRILINLSIRLSAEHLPRSGRVVEFGCGAGDQSLLLAASGYDVTGIDISPTAIAWARNKAQERGIRAAFEVGNVCELADTAAATYDMVVDGHCLHFIFGEERSKYLQTAHRILAPGGWLLLSSICSSSDDSVVGPNYDAATRCYVQSGVAYAYQGLVTDIVAEVLAAGFEIVVQRVTPGIPGERSDFLYVDARKLVTP